jgi:DNA repair protein RadC
MSEDLAPYPNDYTWATWEEQRQQMERPYSPLEIIAHDDKEFDAKSNTVEIPIVYKRNPPRRFARVKLLPVEFKGLRIKLAVLRDPEFDPALTIAVNNPFILYDLMAESVLREPVECMWVVPVTARNRIIGIYEAARGQITGVTIHPVDLLRAVVAVGAPAFFLVHNHPSGEPIFSIEDRGVTKRAATAADILGVKLHDHIVLGSQGRYVVASSIAADCLEPIDWLAAQE